MRQDLYYLSQARLERIRPYFPLSHGVRRVDNRTVLCGIIDVIKNGFQWKEVSREYGPRKTLYNRFIRWSRLGIFNKIFMELSRRNAPVEQLMIDATRLKARRTAGSLLKKGLYPDVSDVQKEGRIPNRMLLDHLPQTEYLLADRGYDATWFGKALRHKRITPCIPSPKCRKTPVNYDKILYRQRHKEENMFGRIKDWRRIAMRYDRCAHTFFSAICIACCVIFYLH